MSEANFESWQEWPEDGLESVDRCPACGSNNRKILYQNLRDRLFGAPGKWTMYICTDCKSGYLDPRPNREKIHLAYANYATHECRIHQKSGSIFSRIKLAIRNGYLNERYGYHFPGGTRWGYWLMFALPSPLRWEWDCHARHLKRPNQNGMKLLDIGSGDGEFLENSTQAGWNAEGIEPDPKAASIAASRNVKVKVGTVDTVDYPSNYFDVICSNQVIEHTHDPKYFLRKTYQWIKPGGTIWIGTPNFNSAIHSRFSENYCNLHPPQHLAIFNMNSLRTLVESAGFHEVRFIKRGFHDHDQYLRSSALKRGLLSDKIYKGVKNAPLKDHLFGMYYELLAWLSIKSCSDLILVARKPR